jgi:hypothetical protein
LVAGLIEREIGEMEFLGRKILANGRTQVAEIMPQ